MKNLLLFSAILIASVGAFAQLSVRPTPGPSSTDSYIYVKDQILYVKNEINLEKNNPGTEEASIYLRDSGQLIQSGSLSTNIGDGFLSVQQNSPVTNAWAYYDWCSPVGNPEASEPTTRGNNKNFGLNSVYEALSGELGTNARMSDNIATKEGYTNPYLTISKRWLYILEEPGTEAEGNYHRINASNGAKAGFGFTMKGVSLGPLPAAQSSHNQIYEFRGRPNSGDFKIPVEGPAYSGSGPTDVNAKMTLSGNPYPSALDLNRVFWDSTNDGKLSAFFFYDEDRSVMSHYYSIKPFGYGVYVPGGNDPDGKVGSSGYQPGFYTNATFFIWNSAGNQTGGGTNGTNYTTAHRFAPIGQGIRFIGESGSEDIWIRNSHRRYIKEGAANHSIFHRPTADGTNDEEANINDPNADISANYEEEDTRTPQLRLYVVFDSALTRDMLLLFSDETTDGYDRGYDGLSPAGMKSDVFFPITSTNGDKLPYVIQGTNYDVDKQIPITLKLDKTSLVEVRAVEEINVPYERAYLFDNQENTYKRLSRGSISSGFTLPAGIYEDRFYIVFRNPNLRSDIPDTELLAKEAVQKNVNFFQNNPAHQLEIRNPQSYVIKSAEIYDMAGKLVINDKNLGDDTKYTFYTGNLSDGMYLVKLTTSEDITIDYKAIVHNK